MSFKRGFQRHQQAKEDPRETFAREVGAALERFARKGGTHQQAALALLRYSAQTFIMAPNNITAELFASQARTAFQKEASAIAEHDPSKKN